MQIVRTLVWVFLLVALVAFSVANWAERVEVAIWSGLVLETNLPAVVIVSFLLGLVPAWLVLRANNWRLERKIRTLQNNTHNAHVSGTASTTSAASTATTTPAPVPSPTPAQSDRPRPLEDPGPLTADDKS